MSAIFKREFKSYFTSPTGYIFLTIMVLLEGLAFSNMFAAGFSDIAYVFSVWYIFLMMFALTPVLTMRTMSEDRRQKTDQALITAPVSLYGIVLGKFFAALAIFMLSFSVTAVYMVVILVQQVTVNLIVYIGNILGVALVGSSLIAMGIFFSSLTEYQFVSFALTLASSIAIYYLDTLLANLGSSTVIDKITEWISFSGRYNAFIDGIIDYSNIVFFLSFAGLFIFLTVRVLDKRRYS